MKSTLVAVLGLLALAGCGTTPVVMSYQQSSTMNKFPASAGRVAVEGFIDQRGEPPKWLGAIRGGFGNPLKVLETEEPVAKIVQAAFAEGVRARTGAGHSAAQYEIRGTIRKLDCSQYVRREAHGIIEVVVIDAATKKERFRRSYASDVVDGSMVNLATGVFASVDDLRRVAQQALQQIVDKALDDPSFRDAITG